MANILLLNSLCVVSRTLKDEIQSWGFYGIQLLWLLWFILDSVDTSSFKKELFNIFQQANTVWSSSEPPYCLAKNAIHYTKIIENNPTPQMWLFSNMLFSGRWKTKSIGGRNVSGLWIKLGMQIHYGWNITVWITFSFSLNQPHLFSVK